MSARWAGVTAALAFLGVTVLLGAAMRWDLATGWLSGRGAVFGFVRHAHSHAGFYGLLTLAWWGVASTLTGPVLPVWFARVHIVCAALATVLFALMGYRAPTMALSTVVAGGWVWTVVAMGRKQPRRRWMGLAPAGVALGVLLVPVIAVTARTDLAMSRQLAMAFIAVMLLLVFVPAALEALHAPRRGPAAVHVLSAVACSFALAFHHSVPVAGTTAMLFHGALLSWSIWRMPARSHLLWLWRGTGPGLAVLALWPRPGEPNVHLAGLHGLILGPLLLTLCEVLLAPPPGWVVAPYVAALAAMVGALAFGSHLWPAVAPVVDAWLSLTMVAALAGAAAWCTLQALRSRASAP